MTRPSPAPLSRLLPALPLVLSAFAGCADSPPPGPEPLVRDSAGVVIHEFPEAVLIGPAALGLAENPTVRIGVLDGAPEYQWTRPVAAARLSDGGFAVLEQAPAEVRVFDRSGRFVRRVGMEGDGPGELRRPAGLAALPADTLLVWDSGSRRLTWFAIEGTAERERTVREPGDIRTIRHVALSPTGGAVVLGAPTTSSGLGNQGRVRETWHVVPITADGEPGPVVGTVPGTEREIEVARAGGGDVVSVRVQGRWWWGEGFAWASTHGVWTADQLALEARHFDRERGLDRIVRITAEDRPFTRALIDSLHRAELDRVDDPAIRDLWRADFEDREYPPGVPPVAAVFGDAAERVWIGLTDPPPEHLSSGALRAVRRWVVFEGDRAATGGETEELTLLGLLTLPPRSHPLWADRDGVLLVRNDAEFDVPYVEWYPYVER